MGPTTSKVVQSPTNIIYVDKLQETIRGLEIQRQQLADKIRNYEQDLPVFKSQQAELARRILNLETIFKELDTLQLTCPMYVYPTPKTT